MQPGIQYNYENLILSEKKQEKWTLYTYKSQL